jgi:hypothetical protein
MRQKERYKKTKQSSMAVSKCHPNTKEQTSSFAAFWEPKWQAMESKDAPIQNIGYIYG